MKLRRPPLAIDPQNPFAGALFQREYFAESLTSLIRKSQDGTVIFVNGPWGSGKTTFLHMWKARLEKDNLPCLTFDAFAADCHEDPFLSFTGEIHTLLKERKDSQTGVEPLTRKFRDAAVDVLKVATPLAAKVAFKLATAGIVGNTELGQLADAAKGTGEDLAGAAESVIQRRIEEYSAAKSATAHFKETLEKVAASIRAENDFPLTIVVDELDRCRPDFALELLERIKHLFDVPGVVFVLLVNQRQIESYIRSVYGASVDAHSYLQKFGDLFVDIPTESESTRLPSGERGFFTSLLKDFGYPHDGYYSAVAEDLALFGEHFGITLREAEHVVRIVALDGAATNSQEFSWHPLREFFSVVKIKRPKLFSAIREQTMNGDDLVAALRIDQLNRRAKAEQKTDLANVTASLLHLGYRGKAHPDQHVSDCMARLNEFYNYGHSAACGICRRLSRFRFRPE